MSDYTKSTNFASKDSLSSGNPLKIVKGTEIDTEFNNIAIAIATKADLASPALTGTPTAPTASLGTSSTQLATTAFVQAALQALYPVGSVYINASDATNPGTLFGFGTWVTVGDGKVLVNYDSTDSSFNSLGKTGGSKDSVLIAHNHTLTDPGHSHKVFYGGGYGSGGNGISPYSSLNYPTSTETTGITIASAGTGSGTNENLQPYVTVKIWKRTA